jgi:hypothetical protein
MLAQRNMKTMFRLNNSGKTGKKIALLKAFQQSVVTRCAKLSSIITQIIYEMTAA